jgi:hypothetical protein
VQLGDGDDRARDQGDRDGDPKTGSLPALGKWAGMTRLWRNKTHAVAIGILWPTLNTSARSSKARQIT